MIDIEKIADGADVIINGYAFTADGDYIRVLNLNNVNSAAVISRRDEIVETTMDEIEEDIMMEYYNRSKSYMRG